MLISRLTRTSRSTALPPLPLLTRGRAVDLFADDTGAATAEYAVATMAAVAFAGLLVVIMGAWPTKRVDRGSAMLATMKSTRARMAFGTTLAAGAIALAGCSAVSLDRVAEDCGGESAGIAVDETAIAVGVSSGGLTCVIKGVFSDKAHQYEVSMAVDEGPNQSLNVDGRSVKVVEFGQSTLLVIDAK